MMFKRQISGLTAGVLTVTLLGSFPAFADSKVVTGNDDGLIAEMINTREPITLTIKKTPRNPHDEVAPGVKPPGPIEGVTFDLQRVENIDVTTTAGRKRAENMTVDSAREIGLGAPISRATNGKGEAVFADLSPCLYLVTEKLPEDQREKYAYAQPFLVLLPLGSVDGTKFEHDGLILVKSQTPPKPPSTPTPTPTPPPGTPPNVPPGKTTRPPVPPETPPGETPPVTTPPEGPPSTPPGKIPPGETPASRLAETGANVIITALAALLLIATGGALMLRNRRERS